MFKSFLLFLGLFILILLGVYFLGRPEENTQLNARYSKYLSGAIVKYTRTYDVEFQTDNFIPQNTTTNEEFIRDLNQHKAENNFPTNQNLLSYARETDDENSSLNGNFGTPDVAPYNSIPTESGCSGLIYDPCLVLGNTIRANGGMNFGSTKYN